ncbi:spore germination protein [Fonticella tunisiensis]|uniref:Spore germination protein KA n=1 Tax=Fonticella tunisiensis TaxID=1096341 RepID=A0A4R7KT82_9CLOT|nr:spore germination protein [Fonticella tunisiensis]TDT61312.1 spore germination protein KA [Fonticella tunisiensis]
MSYKKLSYKKKQPNSNQKNEVIKSSGNSLTQDLKENLERIQETLGNSSDIVVREFYAGKYGQMHIGIVYVDGLIDKNIVQRFILEALMLNLREAELDSTVFLQENELQVLKKAVLPAGEVKEIVDFNELFLHLLSGDTIVIINGVSRGMAIGTKGWTDRGIEEPGSESVVRGPRDGFTETLRTNTALLRRRIRDPNFWIETRRLGRRTKTDVSIAYIKGVASDRVVQEVHRRLDSIDIDAVLESGYIEEFVQDAPYSLFPTIYNTERPDKVVSAILEGRVAILVDGTPFVLLVPVVFIQFFQASEDYYHRFDISTLIRLLRFMCFFLALLVPSFYVAATTFHQEMIPTTLLVSIAAQREGVPFPAAVEALLMEISFEILREAGIRLPRAVGSAISIVGALVLGEAAVRAGIVSPAMVIVVSVTAISNFVSPAFNMAMSIRILRFLFLILASTFGLFGIVLGLIAMVLHLCGLSSFGVPYMSPMAPLIMQDQKDAMVRLPRFGVFKRPNFIRGNDAVRGRNPGNRK